MITRLFNRRGDTHPRAALALLLAMIVGAFALPAYAGLLLARGLFRLLILIGA
jgi:hypothetical protein